MYTKGILCLSLMKCVRQNPPTCTFYPSMIMTVELLTVCHSGSHPTNGSNTR